MAAVDHQVVKGEIGSRKRELLFDIYHKEAEDFMQQHHYWKALKSYNLVWLIFSSSV
jgi:hypothetical protein